MVANDNEGCMKGITIIDDAFLDAIGPAINSSGRRPGV
jgi:hypothetical protein